MRVRRRMMIDQSSLFASHAHVLSASALKPAWGAGSDAPKSAVSLVDLAVTQLRHLHMSWVSKALGTVFWRFMV